MTALNNLAYLHALRGVDDPTMLAIDNEGVGNRSGRYRSALLDTKALIDLNAGDQTRKQALPRPYPLDPTISTTDSG